MLRVDQRGMKENEVLRVLRDTGILRDIGAPEEILTTP